MSNETPPTGLELSDIQSLLAVVDYAADQGALKGWQTINAVAALRQRVSLFLEAVAAQQKAAEEATQAIESTSDDLSLSEAV